MRHSHYTYTSVLSKGESIGVEVEVGQGRREEVVGKGKTFSPFLLNRVNLHICFPLHLMRSCSLSLPQ